MTKAEREQVDDIINDMVFRSIPYVEVLARVCALRGDTLVGPIRTQIHELRQKFNADLRAIFEVTNG